MLIHLLPSWMPFTTSMDGVVCAAPSFPSFGGLATGLSLWSICAV